MRVTRHKWFWAWDYDKEETWLNEMAAKGFSLVAVGFCTYTFEEETEQEYQIRLELLNQVPTHPESQAYIRFLEEAGVEYLGSILRWAYFRKPKSEGNFDLYSDYDSRITHLNRLLKLLGIFAVLEIYLGFYNIWLYFGLHATRANMEAGFLSAGLGLLIAFGFLRIHGKKRALIKEKQIFE